ncbi:hypothetical protein NUW58_g7713 [Xylaria curta]|uniref:Uncharacterized protein n=1 Tax=Xylaria curta TaxID=42375 RepID=A0ACC1NHB8_9PEZI|nr:hypothetical protein NUW58_g7713 [Xylaria curta]
MADFAEIFHSLSPDKQEALLNGPAAPPPPGVVSNFDNPPNRNELAFAVTTSALALSSVVVILWIFAKAFCQRKVYPGDAFIFAGYGIFIGSCYCLYYWMNLTGVYVHSWDVRMVYVAQNLYGSTLMTLKIGVLLEWLRIFVPKGTRDSFWWTCITNLALNVLFYVAAKLVENFACFPHETIWDFTVEGHCLDQKSLALASAIVNLVSDLLILALPQIVIWKLNMSVTKKPGVSLVFAVGVFCCVVAVFRVITSRQYYISTDPIYDLSPVALWNIVELTLVIMIACLPSIPAVFKGPRLRSLWRPMKSWAGPSQNTSAGGSRWKRTPHRTAESPNQEAYH